jgi:tripartite-type tricarboxylate transporter receptor subunit TctC
VVKTIQEYAAKALADPQVRSWLVSTGQAPVGNPPDEFDAQYKADIVRYAKVIADAKIPKQE